MNKTIVKDKDTDVKCVHCCEASDIWFPKVIKTRYKEIAKDLLPLKITSYSDNDLLCNSCIKKLYDLLDHIKVNEDTGKTYILKPCNMCGEIDNHDNIKSMSLAEFIEYVDEGLCEKIQRNISNASPEKINSVIEIMDDFLNDHVDKLDILKMLKEQKQDTDK